MSTHFKNVHCDYTGGGIWVYTALYNNEVWILTDFNLAGSYDMPIEQVENDIDEESGCIAYEKHNKAPSVPYPTWEDLLCTIGGHPYLGEIESIVRRNGHELKDRIL